VRRRDGKEIVTLAKFERTTEPRNAAYHAPSETCLAGVDD
jgi:hypothetical protein